MANFEDWGAQHWEAKYKVLLMDIKDRASENRVLIEAGDTIYVLQEDLGGRLTQRTLVVTESTMVTGHRWYSGTTPSGHRRDGTWHILWIAGRARVIVSKTPHRGFPFKEKE